ncbi:MAG: hypothetical protein CUN55_03980 [Phototrophicales bacterium]|nr:MAG: hypothetical protein CUN55_03980 [Phototrophicales bacterium]
MTTSADPQALIQRLRSKHQPTIREALAEARERGWLQDGTFNGALIYGAKWQGADLRDAQLQKATLSGVVLQGADLTNADLCGAEMIDSDWREAKARRVKMIGVDAIAAKLSAVDFTDADLSGAALGNATLSFTRFQYTNLQDVDFNNAIFDNTVFVDVDLSTARNLETVRHYGPSAFDIQTLLRSEGVADDFWRASGVPESVLQHLARMRKMPDPYYNVYISYSYPDRFFAYQLQAELRTMGVRCWLQEHQLAKNVDFYKSMKLGIRPQDRTLLLASQYTLQSWWIEDELMTAVGKSLLLPKEQTPLLIIDLDGAIADLAEADDLRERLTAYPIFHFNAISDEHSFKVALQPVLAALQRPTARS